MLGVRRMQKIAGLIPWGDLFSFPFIPWASAGVKLEVGVGGNRWRRNLLCWFVAWVWSIFVETVQPLLTTLFAAVIMRSLY